MDEVRGSGVEKGAGKPARKERKNAFGAKDRTLFLERLAETSCVVTAAAAIGRSRAACQQLRRRNVKFANGWRRAIQEGREALAADALASVRGRAAEGAIDLAEVTRTLGMSAEPAPKAAGGRQVKVRHVPIAQVQDEIVRRVEAVARRLDGR